MKDSLFLMITIALSACCKDLSYFRMLGILIPCIWGFEFILKIKGSKPRA